MAQRPDPYSTFHKGLRKVLFDAAVQLGRLDAAKDDDVNSLSSELRELITLLRSHAMHEETYFHPLIAGTRTAEEAAHTHGDHETELRHIEDLILALQKAPAIERQAAAAALYQEWNLFIAQQLVHLHYEERVVLNELRRAVPDERILEAHGRLVASLHPSETAQSLSLICEAEAAPTVKGLLLGLKDRMPAEAFEQLTESLFARSARAQSIAEAAGIGSPLRI